MSTNSSIDDLNNHVLIGDCNSYIKHLTLDTDHLYRHLTEVNGRDTRGGYIEGVLEFQDYLLVSSFALKISLVSAGGSLDKRLSVVVNGSANKRIHPNLLYMTRFDGAKRQRELEARAPMWKIDLEICDGKVYWWTESESQPLYRQEICDLRINPDTKLRSILDLKDLHLTVITPLVRTNVNGIRVKDGISMRRPMFEDEIMDDGEWDEIVRKLDKFYTGKDGKAEMDRVCLQFDLHNVTDGNEELKPTCSIISYPIVNSKSRNLGILDLLPDIISAQKACCSYGRTIYLPSKFKLPTSEKDVFPRFVVQFHNDGYVLDARVKQPLDVKIFASQLFIFKTPVQDEESIRQIYLSGGKIFLEAYRPKDRQASNVKHEFEFKVHTTWQNSSIDWCSFCLENPDKIGTTMEESLKHRLQTAGVAKPGTKRRKRDEISVGSPASVGQREVIIQNGIVDVDGAPTELFNDLQEFVNNSSIENIDEIDIDELVRNDIPDVLMGVNDAVSVVSDSSQSPDNQELARCMSPAQTYGSQTMSFISFNRGFIDQPPGAPPGAVPLPPGAAPPPPPPPGAAAPHGSSMVDLVATGDSPKSSIQIDYDSITYNRLTNISGSSVQNLTPKRMFPKGLSPRATPSMRRSLISSTESLESESNKSISTTSIISRINSLNRKRRDSAASENDSAYKSHDSFSSSINFHESSRNETPVASSDSLIPRKQDSDTEVDSDSKVSELTRKFGGASKKCIEKIKSKVSKSEEEKTVNLESKPGRNDCFPAFVFMLTPIAVVFLGVILNFIWNIYGGVSELLSE